MRKVLLYVSTVVSMVLYAGVGTFGQSGDSVKRLTAVDLRSMLGEVSQISDPIKREDVKALVIKRWSEERALQEAEYLDTLRESTEAWYSNEGDYKKIPKQLWDKLRAVDKFQFSHARLGQEVLSPAREPKVSQESCAAIH
jgi:hypothetical protein